MKVGHELIPYECHWQGGVQFFAFTSSGQIITLRRECVGVSPDKKSIISVDCLENDKSQLWDYKQEVLFLIMKIDF